MYDLLTDALLCGHVSVPLSIVKTFNCHCVQSSAIKPVSRLTSVGDLGPHVEGIFVSSCQRYVYCWRALW